MANRKNKNVILLWNLMILWGLTADSGVLGFGNVHFFLPILYAVLLRTISGKELLPFPFLFVRSAFPPLLKYPSLVVTVAPAVWESMHYCVHPHSAAGWGMITATTSELEAEGLWVLYPRNVGSHVAWSKGPPAANISCSRSHSCL